MDKMGKYEGPPPESDDPPRVEEPATTYAAAVGRLFGQVMRRTGRPPAAPNGLAMSEAVAAAVERAVRDETGKMTVEELAHAATMSTCHFSRRFRQETGVPPSEFLLRIRIARAMELLHASDLDVRQVARTVGYADHAAFSRAFSRLVGAPPREYRAARRREERRVGPGHRRPFDSPPSASEGGRGADSMGAASGRSF